ncbi:MAG: YecA family protein [Deferrisomatales bacterium]
MARHQRAPRTPFSAAGLPPEAEQLMLAAVRRAGFDPGDEGEQMMGLTAVTAALQVYEAVVGRRATARAPAGRNDPCPCGSGRKYKKCCQGKGEAEALGGLGGPPFPLQDPALVPRLNRQELFAEDMANLARLFDEDPGLCEVRFAGGEALAFVLDEGWGDEEPSEGDDDADQDRLDGLAFRYFEEVESPEALGDLEAALLEAAPRWAESVADLRSLALGVALTGLEEDTEEEEPNPLHTLIFRATLAEAFEAEHSFATAGDAFGALGATMLPGETTSLAELIDRFWALSVPASGEDEGAVSLGDAVRVGQLPGGLAFPSLLPCLARLAALAPAQEPEDEELLEILVDSARELGPEDAELVVEGLGEVLDDPADGETAAWVSQALEHLGGGAFGPLGVDFLLSALRQGYAPGLEGEPEVAGDATRLRDALSATYLESYGDFLWDAGLPELARRTWRLGELHGPLSPAVEEKLARGAAP